MISELQTINRFLASVDALETDTGAKEEHVAEYYRTQYVYPVRDDFVLARDFCLGADLVGYRKEYLILTNLGRAYLNLGVKKGKDHILEPNIKQKDFLSRKVFLVSENLDLVEKILYNFNKRPNGELYLSKTEISALENQNFLRLLIQLGILIEKEDVVELALQYLELLSVVISRTVMVITPEAFKKSEDQKMEVSRIAEEYVLESERKRLKNIGAIKQEKDIDYVATKNVAAGYDIASFNNKDSVNHDRFIEVKAGKLNPIRFFVSKNEFENAKRLKAKYYIYYVCMEDKKPKEIYIYQNPTEGVMKDPNFEIHTDTYEISEK